MSVVSSIARNTVQQILGKGLAVVFGFASVALLTRMLGPAVFGDYTTTIVFVQFFGTLADLGLYIIALKKLSEPRDDRDAVFQNILSLRIVSALVFVVLAPLAVLAFQYSPDVKLGVLIATPLTLLVAMNQLYVGLYQRSLATERAVASEVLGKIVLFLLLLGMYFAHAPLLMIFVAVVVGSAVQLAFNVVFARKYVVWGMRWDPPILREIAHESWPIAVSIALNLIYFRADTIILSLYFPRETVGLYGATYKILEVLVTFPAMFAALIMPLLTRAYAADDREGFRTSMQRSFDALATIALPIVAGVFLLAFPIMSLIAGDAFRPAGSVLRVLIFAVGVIFFGNLFGNAIVAIGRQRSMMPFYGGVAVFALLGYFFFIPSYGMWGASAMTVATEIAITLASFFVVWRATRHGLRFAQFLRAGTASVIMVLVLVAFRESTILALLPAGLVLYILVLASIGGLRRSELRELFQR